MSNQELHPGAILELSGFYWKTCTLHAAVKLDLFTILGDTPKNADAVADEISGSANGTFRLLNALCAMGLLIKTGDAYTAAPASRRYLDSRSQDYIGHIILHHHHLVESWARLDEAVRTGSPVRTSSSHASDPERKSFLMGMHNLANLIAPRVAELIDLNNCNHLLDLGGGPGTYAIHFCLRNSHLKATVCDLAGSRPFAEQNIAAHNVSDRIDFRALDYLHDEIPGQYDAAWLSHILHAEGPKTCAAILKKTVSALNPGAMVLIHEFVLQDSMDAPLFPALFSLNMLIGTRSGQSYSETSLKEMLAAAGCRDIRRLEFTGPNDSGIIVGNVGS